MAVHYKCGNNTSGHTQQLSVLILKIYVNNIKKIIYIYVLEISQVIRF